MPYRVCSKTVQQFMFWEQDRQRRSVTAYMQRERTGLYRSCNESFMFQSGRSAMLYVILESMCHTNYPTFHLQAETTQHVQQF